jgi:hypothetical protein
MFKFSDSKKKLSKKLCKAARTGDLAGLKKAVEEGAEINSLFGHPLFAAAYYGGSADCVRYLLERGAIVDARNEVNCTALMAAAQEGHEEIVKILLAAGAERALRGRGGRTALDFALVHEQAGMKPLLEEQPPALRADGPHEVTLRRQLGNRLLEEVFDFAAHERITLVKKEENGTVEAITRDGFSQIEDKARLREAFAAYVKKGGAPDESAVFPERLTKPARQKPPASQPGDA